jgi:hypothetical protein
MKSKFTKIFTTILMSCVFLFSVLTYAQTPSNNIDGVYTLKQIIDESGNISNFTYGGEITIANSIATLKSPEQDVTWSISESDCELSNNILYETNTQTNSQYIYQKLEK